MNRRYHSHPTRAALLPSLFPTTEVLGNLMWTLFLVRTDIYQLDGYGLYFQELLDHFLVPLPLMAIDRWHIEKEKHLKPSSKRLPLLNIAHPLVNMVFHVRLRLFSVCRLNAVESAVVHYNQTFKPYRRTLNVWMNWYKFHRWNGTSYIQFQLWGSFPSLSPLRPSLHLLPLMKS